MGFSSVCVGVCVALKNKQPPLGSCSFKIKFLAPLPFSPPFIHLPESSAKRLCDQIYFKNLKISKNTNLPVGRTGNGFPSNLSKSVVNNGILGSSYATTSLYNIHKIYHYYYYSNLPGTIIQLRWNDFLMKLL